MLAVCFVTDGLVQVSNGVLSGAGRQATAAATSAVCIWGVGIPMAALLALRQVKTRDAVQRSA